MSLTSSNIIFFILFILLSHKFHVDSLHNHYVDTNTLYQS